MFYPPRNAVRALTLLLMIFFEGNNDHQRLNPEPTALRGSAEAILAVQARLQNKAVSSCFRPVNQSFPDFSCSKNISFSDILCWCNKIFIIYLQVKNLP
jgi:hypothetical protein